MSDITDKYLAENIDEQYVQEIDVGMRNLLDDMLNNISDLHKHLKRYKRQKDIRPFANTVVDFTSAYNKRFKKWQDKAKDILSHEI